MNSPAAHEFEVNVFGRGYGESVLIHLGSGQWFLADSLRTSSGNPAALVYLSEIGVRADQGIRYILATHWHDDHVAGLSDIYAQCPNAIVSFPAAMARDEWRAFRGAVSNCGSERFGSGVRELEQIAALRKQFDRNAFRMSKANTLLMRGDSSGYAHGQTVSVELLSPSDQDVEDFLERLATAELPKPGSRVEPFPRNDVSVAAWVSIGSHHVLLGADLEVTGAPNTGWEAVLASPATIQGSAGMFKISHHGSENGHHPDIWARHLDSGVHAVLAPFNRNPNLPRPRDVDRIVAITPNAFATGHATKRAKRRVATVEKTLRENGHKISALADTGHVRLRLDPRDPLAQWTVVLMNGALLLRDLQKAS